LPFIRIGRGLEMHGSDEPNARPVPDPLSVPTAAFERIKSMFKKSLLLVMLATASIAIHAQTIVPMFGGNAQHTAVYGPAAQHLNSIHWSASIDLNNTGAFAHYGAPLITPANTIVVPQKTGANGGFQINVFNAVNGAAMYSLTTDYVQPSHNWI